MTASFTRIETKVHSDYIVTAHDITIEHQDGTITVFGSEAAYEIFKQGLLATNYTLYDKVGERWIKEK